MYPAKGSDVQCLLLGPDRRPSGPFQIDLDDGPHNFDIHTEKSALLTSPGIDFGAFPLAILWLSIADFANDD